MTRPFIASFPAVLALVLGSLVSNIAHASVQIGVFKGDLTIGQRLDTQVSIKLPAGLDESQLHGSCISAEIRPAEGVSRIDETTIDLKVSYESVFEQGGILRLWSHVPVTYPSATLKLVSECPLAEFAQSRNILLELKPSDESVLAKPVTDGGVTARPLKEFDFSRSALLASTYKPPVQVSPPEVVFPDDSQIAAGGESGSTLDQNLSDQGLGGLAAAFRMGSEALASVGDSDSTEKTDEATGLSSGATETALAPDGSSAEGLSTEQALRDQEQADVQPAQLASAHPVLNMSIPLTESYSRQEAPESSAWVLWAAVLTVALIGAGVGWVFYRKRHPDSSSNDGRLALALSEFRGEPSTRQAQTPKPAVGTSGARVEDYSQPGRLFESLLSDDVLKPSDSRMPEQSEKSVTGKLLTPRMIELVERFEALRIASWNLPMNYAREIMIHAGDTSDESERELRRIRGHLISLEWAFEKVKDGEEATEVELEMLLDCSNILQSEQQSLDRNNYVPDMIQSYLKARFVELNREDLKERFAETLIQMGKWSAGLSLCFSSSAWKECVFRLKGKSM